MRRTLLGCTITAATALACSSDTTCEGAGVECAIGAPELSFESRPLFAGCLDESVTDLPRVAVGGDRSFALTIRANVSDIISGTLRAEILTLRAEAMPLTVPLVKNGNDWRATATVAWPEDGPAAFRVRVAGKEAVGAVEVQTAHMAVLLKVGAVGASPLIPVRAEVRCGMHAVPGQAVSFVSLPETVILPASGQTAEDGSLEGTLRVASADAFPVRVDAVAGSSRAGCIITATGAITDAGTCAGF